MLKKFELSDISLSFLEAACIPSENYQRILALLQLLECINEEHLLIEISETWQLQLISGHNLEYFKTYAGKRDKQGYDITYYSVLSGNMEAIKLLTLQEGNMQWGGERIHLIHFAILSKNLDMLKYIWIEQKGLQAGDVLQNALFLSLQNWAEGYAWFFEKFHEQLKDFAPSHLELLLEFYSLDPENLLQESIYNELFITYMIISTTESLDLFFKCRSDLLLEANSPQNDVFQSVIIAFAALRYDTQAIQWCYHLVPQLMAKSDFHNNSLAKYALRSSNPRQFNYYISLLGISRIQIHSSGTNDNTDLLSLNTSLDNNWFLLGIEGIQYDTEHRILCDEISKKLDRNHRAHEFIRRSLFLLLVFAPKEISFMIIEHLSSLYLSGNEKNHFNHSFFSQDRKAINQVLSRKFDASIPDAHEYDSSLRFKYPT